MTEPKSLQEQADEILAIAEANGVEQNFFFVTTFKRYQVQINLLTDLERRLYTEELDTKTIDAYNRTSSAANTTAGTLMRIITSMRPKDPLARAIMNANRRRADNGDENHS